MPKTTSRKPSKRLNGEGSVWKSEARGRWFAEVTMPDGRRRRLTAKTQAEAVAKRNQLVGDPRAAAGDNTMTTKAWLDQWVTDVLPRTVKPATVTNYTNIVNYYIVPNVGRIKLSQLAPEHVDRMMNELEARGLSARTVALARTILRRALQVAQQRHKVVTNAAALTDAPRQSAPRTDDALTAADALAVLQTAEGDRLEALAVLVLMVGMRQGEALALVWSDVDLDVGTLTVSEAKTDAGRRTVPLPPTVVSALRHHRIASRYSGPDDYVFASTTGTRINPRNALRWWHGLTERAGVGRRRFHASRHTAATLMLNAGVPLEVVSATLGHAGLAITADVYARVGSDLQRQAADVMEGVLGAGVTTA
jgi:integrase